MKRCITQEAGKSGVTKWGKTAHNSTCTVPKHWQIPDGRRNGSKNGSDVTSSDGKVH